MVQLVNTSFTAMDKKKVFKNKCSAIPSHNVPHLERIKMSFIEMTHISKVLNR